MAPVSPSKPRVEAQSYSPEKRNRVNESESAEMPSDPEEPVYHSSGTLMPPPPKSGLGADHPYANKVVNTPEVQLAKPRVPHPIPYQHAMSCLALVNEIEHLTPSNDYKISPHITDKLVKLLCPPGFSWELTFNTSDKRKQAVKLAQSATEILNMRVRREAQARDMAQRKLDTTAKGMFHFFKYDIEREFQLLKKFRRSLFCVELGEKVSAELERIKRLKEASINTGIGEAEQMLFDRLLKAKLTAVVESAAKTASSPNPDKSRLKRVRCSYCKKRHPGGASKCKKRAADRRAARSDETPTPSGTQPTAKSQTTPKATSTQPHTGPKKRKAPAIVISKKSRESKEDE